jgi:methionyl-tRNA synthetase
MRFYITTTLPYVNAEPHIGFALEIIQADVFARYHRQKGEEVFFNTGTDEHGLKIYRKALEGKLDPQAYCDQYAAKFNDLKDALNLSYNNFIRTTDAHHKAAAQEFWRRCAKNGDIYKKKYSTLYCVGCELEKTKSELVGERCPIHPNLELEVIEEENYFFKYSKYADKLLKLYTDDPNFVVPAHRLNEIAQFTKNGLEDFSISRLKAKMPWGVPVPDDNEHVMYVWFDALVNYISALGWPENEQQFKAFWPGMQVAGKDNLRQQSSMWQAMLLSAGLPTSREILIHGFITVNGQKMSKSLGNVVGPFDLVKRYGTDAVRYYLLREIPSTDDGDFSEEKFKLRFNADLANGLGNLVSRVVRLAHDMEHGARSTEHGNDQGIKSFFAEFRIADGLEYIWGKVREANKYVDEKKPWELAKTDVKKFEMVMGNLVDQVACIAVLLQPFLPGTSERIATALQTGKVEPLFKRIK